MSKNQTFYYSIPVKIQKLKETINISINDRKLTQKEYAKYLGVSIDCHLSWEKHIKITSCKISKSIGILKKMRKFLQEKQLKNVYNVFIKPCTEYNILVQGGVTKTQRCKYLKIVLFDINLKLQQGKFMKQFSFDLQPESIIKHFPLRYIDSVNNANSEKLIIP